MFPKLLLVSILLLNLFPLSVTEAAESCIQVIQYAENNTTDECQAFSTPCDVPTGWTPVDECKIDAPTAKVVTPKFEVQKFASCEAMEDKIIDIVSRYQSRYWYPMYTRSDSLFGLTKAEPMSVSAVAEKSAGAPTPTVAPSADA
jgi:hypothetical protein